MKEYNWLRFYLFIPLSSTYHFASLVIEAAIEHICLCLDKEEMHIPEDIVKSVDCCEVHFVFFANTNIWFF